MRANRRRHRRCRFEPLEPRLVLAATLTNGDAEGSLTVKVDGYGAFGSSVGSNSSDATFNPVGILTAGNTTFESGVLIRLLQSSGVRFLTSGSIGGSGSLVEPPTNGTSTEVVSGFNFEGLDFLLTQELLPLFASNGVRIGSQLNQTYAITNNSAAPISFELLRYFDGDLKFAGSGIGDDIGGRLADLDLLYESDTVAGQVERSTFIGISAVGGNPLTPGRFEINSYSGLQNRILAGRALQDIIQGDLNGDHETDSGYDVTLALRNVFLLGPGAQALYTTTTLFGTGIIEPPRPEPPPVDLPLPETLPPPPAIDPLPPPPSQPSLLLVLRPLVPVVETTLAYGTNGYFLPPEQASFSAGIAPQAIDAALANDEVNEAFLLAGFLDFVDPEMLVVDLGDEPPARVAGDGAKMSPTNETASVNRGAELPGAAAGDRAENGAVEYMKPPLAAAQQPWSIVSFGAQLQSLAVNYWEWLATSAAAVLLTGAAWKSRDTWMQAARRMWSR